MTRILLATASIGLASVAQAQTQPTEPPPTPAPTTPPSTPVPTVTMPMVRLLPPLQAGGATTLAVGLPTGSVFFESSADMKSWADDSSRVPAGGVGVFALEKAPGDVRRFYRVRDQR